MDITSILEKVDSEMFGIWFFDWYGSRFLYAMRFCYG